MSKFKMGDKYWTFYTNAEIYGEVYWPFIQLKELEVYYTGQLHEVDQVYFFKTKDEAIDSMIKHLEGLRDKQ